MKKFNFTIRIHKPKVRTSLADLQYITISNITLLSKPTKFGDICLHLNNKRLFKYHIRLSKTFNKISGSNTYPTLSFNGDYIDIIVSNFPRYPAFYQDTLAVRNMLQGYGYTNYMNEGFPTQLLYRNIEIILNEN